MKLILSGGGNERDALAHHQRFAAWLKLPAPLLYLPGDAFPAQDSYQWLSSVLKPFGIESIEMWASPQQYDTSRLHTYAGIYIGGGNTFRTLRDLKASELDKWLAAAAKQGTPIFGGSAGAIVLGAHIGTCAHMDHNDTQLPALTGLDLVAGFAIWCHYEPANDTLIHTFVRRHSIPVLAISERSSIEVLDRKVLASQSEGAFKFDSNGKTKLEVGESC